MPNLVELPLLGVLREQSLHGYELKRHVESLIGYFGTLSFGSLYPMLRALELRGHLIRTEGSQSGRIIHRYHITAKGEERFVQLMHDPSVALTQKLLFFQAIPATDREQILRSHMGEWMSRLKKCRHEQARADVVTVGRYRAALLNREVDRLEKDMVWLQKLIDEESTSAASIQDRQTSFRGPLKRPRKRRQSNPGTRSR